MVRRTLPTARYTVRYETRKQIKLQTHILSQQRIKEADQLVAWKIQRQGIDESIDSGKAVGKEVLNGAQTRVIVFLPYAACHLLVREGYVHKSGAGEGGCHGRSGCKCTCGSESDGRREGVCRGVGRGNCGQTILNVQ